MAGNATVGARVFTADGKRIGIVDEVSSIGCFKLDTGSDWLGLNLVASAPGNEIRLSFIEASLGYMKTTGDNEGHGSVHTH